MLKTPAKSNENVYKLESLFVPKQIGLTCGYYAVYCASFFLHRNQFSAQEKLLPARKRDCSNSTSSLRQLRKEFGIEYSNAIYSVKEIDLLLKKNNCSSFICQEVASYDVFINLIKLALSKKLPIIIPYSTKLLEKQKYTNNKTSGLHWAIVCEFINDIDNDKCSLATWGKIMTVSAKSLYYAFHEVGNEITKTTYLYKKQINNHKKWYKTHTEEKTNNCIKLEVIPPISLENFRQNLVIALPRDYELDPLTESIKNIIKPIKIDNHLELTQNSEEDPSVKYPHQYQLFKNIEKEINKNKIKESEVASAVMALAGISTEELKNSKNFEWGWYCFIDENYIYVGAGYNFDKYIKILNTYYSKRFNSDFKYTDDSEYGLTLLFKLKDFMRLISEIVNILQSDPLTESIKNIIKPIKIDNHLESTQKSEEDPSVKYPHQYQLFKNIEQEINKNKIKESEVVSAVMALAGISTEELKNSKNFEWGWYCFIDENYIYIGASYNFDKYIKILNTYYSKKFNSDFKYTNDSEYGLTLLFKLKDFMCLISEIVHILQNAYSITEESKTIALYK